MTDTTRGAAQLPVNPPRSQRVSLVDRAASPGTRERRLFPGWRWIGVAFAFLSPATSGGRSADA